MALIIMAVYDTEENGRSEYTKETLNKLFQTVNFDKDRLLIIDNNSCLETKKNINYFYENSKVFTMRNTHNLFVITNSENLGTAKAINQGLKLRKEGENCIKIDNDVIINRSGWVEEMEAVIERDPTIGIVGLKRKDIDFDANNANPEYRSQLVQLSHERGQSWITVEKGMYIMGTCTMFNHKLIDKIGGMKQPGLYGLDDTLYSLRSELSGFWNCYLPHVDIDHIDRGDNPYTQLKQLQAGMAWDEYNEWHKGYINGTKSLWEDFE